MVSSAKNPVSPGGVETIYVVEDEMSLRRPTRDSLKQKGLHGNGGLER